MIRMSPAKEIFFAIAATAPSFRPPDHRQIAAARKRKHAARGAPAPASMGVVVVRVGSVAVAVLLPGMDVAVGVRLAGRVAGRLDVAMMAVVAMAMVVLHRPVRVFVLVPLGQVQP